jgi:two-component system NtrC family sensor kinase
VEWSPLDGAERLLWRLGEPSLDATLRSEPSDRSPLTRLPAYGLRSALRVPLFHRGVVVGSAAIYAYEPGAFGAREGIAFEQCMRTLGARLGTSTVEAIDVVGLTAPVSTAVTQSAVSPAEPSSPSASVSPSTALPEPERLSVLAELVSGVAHELNNPLTTILGYAQLLPSLEGDDGRRAMTTIEHEAQRAGRIVRNLLYFARQHRPRVEPLDLNAVLQRVIEVRRYHLEASNVRLDVRLGVVPELVGDPYQLEQVFLNLLTNAEQALPDGGTITIESGASGGVARVTVTDTGAGIPEALASRIFEPFFTTHDTGEGEGLGLSIAYGIVQAHGGHMAAEQAPGGGARLVVELPIPPEARALVPSEMAGDQRGHGERVLVVEQAAAVRALVTAILGSSGYAVRAVTSSAEALQALSEGPIDLVVVGAAPAAGDAGSREATLVDQIVQRWPRLQSRLLRINNSGEVQRPATSPPATLTTLDRPFTAAELLGAVRTVLAAAER